MFFEQGKAKDVKIAYIGGGSRGWARGLMSDLAVDERMSGKVFLYDIDYEAAQDNMVIGNRISQLRKSKSNWQYFASDNIEETLTDANFVVISILPGTFEEMHSDVHAPEEYGIYQSVGDSTGPGGIIRSLRSVPMFEEIALKVKQFCPQAWVINYTNPMTVCIRTLYSVFPKIKAFGCCHEVFSTQELIANIYNQHTSSRITRQEVDINLYGINHFTWVYAARYRDIDLMPLIKEYSRVNKNGAASKELNWMNKNFSSNQSVKFDLFNRMGILAAAGDRHLAEFCPGDWYLKDLQTIEKWKFNITTVDWRKDDQKRKIQDTKDIINGKKELKIKVTGEEGVNQMAALLGLGSYVTNVNLPNTGQITNLPINSVVETNAYFSADSVVPLISGAIPIDVNNLVIRHVYNQELTVSAALKGDYEKAFIAFISDSNVNLSLDKAKELYDKMLYNTKKYLPFYENYKETQNKD